MKTILDNMNKLEIAEGKNGECKIIVIQTTQNEPQKEDAFTKLKRKTMS